MNIFCKVTLRSLKMNRIRTIVTIIGIMLSAAMICAVTTFVSSMRNYVLNYTVYTNGDWHGAAYDAQWSDVQEIAAAEEISDASYGQLLGYAKIDSKNEYKPYMYVIGGEDKFFQMMPVHLVLGELPKNENEIILPEHLSANGDLTYQMGDTITLELGSRMMDGFSLGQNNPCYTYNSRTHRDELNDETIEVRETRTYTVVGFYERPSFEGYTAPGYTALTKADEVPADTAKYDVYFKMKRVADAYSFVMESMDLGGSVNGDVVRLYGVSRYDSYTMVLINLAVIVIGLIMFGSISLIYNAFSISVSERTRQFGLLSSVGATRKQTKKMVLFEAIAVSTVGIPLGILAGIGGISVTLMLIGNKFSRIVGNFDKPMQVCVSGAAVVIAVIVALVTVLISAWIPSKRATKVSAVEAIRQNGDTRADGRSVRTSGLTLKLFGLPGSLACKYYKRSKRKYRATVVSLFMSIVLFVSASAFTDYLVESVAGGFDTEDFDLQYMLDTETEKEHPADDILELFLSDQYVTAGAYYKSGYVNGRMENRYLSEKFLEDYSVPFDSGDMGEENAKKEESLINGYVYFVSDEEYEKLLTEYHLDREEYLNAQAPLGIFVDGRTQFDSKKQKYVTVNTLNSDVSEFRVRYVKNREGYLYVGDEADEEGNRVLLFRNENDEQEIMEVPYEEGIVEITLRSGKTISEAPFYVRAVGDLTMIYPIGMMDSVFPKEITAPFFYTSFCLISEDHRASYQNLKKLLGENGLDSRSLINYAERIETDRNMVTIVQVFAYGFVALISLIAAANVFNTISTNISLRRREFAMLKSVGMTQKGFQRMMNFECLLYGSRALLFGLPVSAGVAYLIYRAVDGGYETVYRMPWKSWSIATLSVFLVVFATMMYSMRKLKAGNLIDTLKNENL